MISLIVAASTNSVIGDAGKLPWRLVDDLKRFKYLTMGKPMIMGRMTWESIGGPLPGRQSIVLTRQADFVAEGCDVADSPPVALALAGDAEEIMIIGGSQVYELFMPQATRLYVTRVHAQVSGDACFPEIDERIWSRVECESHQANEDNQFAFDFMRYDRRARS